MRYLKAVEISEKPFIQWHGWAKSLQELQALGEEDNPLILAENLVPEYQFGVCPLKIVGGVLVERSTGEMAEFEAEYLAEQTQIVEQNKINDINSATFVYASKQFPMHEAARLRYFAIGLYTGSTGDVDFLATDGTIVTVTNSNKTLFLYEFYKKIQELTSPTIL
ncbi:MAG: hypothetical protein JST78_09505 [Bacteroidetes bacterium]|nr:hypothetical protein [Bacteroidota bacterium]